MTCAVPGCGKDAACDGYDVHWRFVASYCLEHGKEAVAREAAPRTGVHVLRAHAPGTCPHGGERRSCREPSCQETRVWDDDPTIDDEYTRELRRQGFKTFSLTGTEDAGEPGPEEPQPPRQEPGDPGWLSEFFRRMGFRVHRDRQAVEPETK